MKHTLTILFISLIIYSCGEDKTIALNNQILELENSNMNLRDSIAMMMQKKVMESNIIGSTLNERHKINEETKFEFIFNYQEKFPAYKVYELDEDGQDKKMILDKVTENRFLYSYSPTKVGINIIRLRAVFELENQEWAIPAYTSIIVTK